MTPLNGEAIKLLAAIVQVREWALEGNKLAKPYLDADAIRISEGEVHFHRDRFCALYATELEKAREEQ